MTDTSRTSHEDDDMRAELARLREVTKGAYWVVETAPHARIRGSGAYELATHPTARDAVQAFRREFPKADTVPNVLVQLYGPLTEWCVA